MSLLIQAIHRTIQGFCYVFNDISHIVPLTLGDHENGYACDSLQSSTYDISFVPKLCQLITLTLVFSKINFRA